MSILQMFVEHWQAILGLAILIGGVLLCGNRGIDFNRGEGPFRRYR